MRTGKNYRDVFPLFIAVVSVDSQIRTDQVIDHPDLRRSATPSRACSFIRVARVNSGHSCRLSPSTRRSVLRLVSALIAAQSSKLAIRIRYSRHPLRACFS